jgi:hypothetical protein
MIVLQFNGETFGNPHRIVQRPIVPPPQLRFDRGLIAKVDTAQFLPLPVPHSL